jgi:hypothetical protein
MNEATRSTVAPTAPGGIGPRVAVEPWNMPSGPSDAPALRVELAQAPEGSAQQLDVLLCLTRALRKAGSLKALVCAGRAQRLVRRRGDASSTLMAAVLRSTCCFSLGRCRQALAAATARSGRAAKTYTA